MAITSGYFNSVNGDRKYNADQMSEYFEGIINEGVCQHIGGGLAVTSGTGLTVSVATGKAFIGQKWIKNDAALTLTITTAADQARIDAVVLRRNTTNRVCEIAVKTGTPSASPSAPAMTRNATTYEMALAYVNVAAGATSVTVTDKRADTTVCGWATVAQATSGEVDAQLNALKTGFDGVTYASPAAMVQGNDGRIVGDLNDGGVLFVPSNQGYISNNGTIVPTNVNFKYTEPIHLDKMDRIDVVCSSVNGVVSIISKIVGTTITPLVVASTDSKHSYSYVADSSIDVVVCVKTLSSTYAITKKINTTSINNSVDEINDIMGGAELSTGLLSVATGTDMSSTNSIRFGAPKCQVSGSIIDKMYFKTLSITGAARFYVGELINDEIKLIATFIANVSPSKTTYVNGVDFTLDLPMQKNYIIGYNNPATVGCYTNVGTGKSYAVFFQSGEDRVIGNSYEYSTSNYDVNIGCTYKSIITQNSDKIEEQGEIIENLLNNSHIYYGKKVASPESTLYFMDSDIISCSATYDSSTDSEVRIIRYDHSSGIDTTRTDFVNFANNEIGFYNKSVWPETNLTVYEKRTVPFSFVVGREYVIFSIRYLGKYYTIAVIDKWNPDNSYYFTLANVSGSVGRGWGRRTYQSGEGVTVAYFKDNCLEPKASRVCFIGDSYIEGESIATQKDKRYSALIKTALNGNAFIWGAGGAPASLGATWIDNILSLNHSDYYVLAFGMNDTNFTTWKTAMETMITKVENAGGVPILCTIPPAAPSITQTDHDEMNDYIRETNYDYVDIAKVASLNNDGETYDSSKLLPDGVHPTVATHKLIFECFRATLPELFGTEIANN